MTRQDKYPADFEWISEFGNRLEYKDETGFNLTDARGRNLDQYKRGRILYLLEGESKQDGQNVIFYTQKQGWIRVIFKDYVLSDEVIDEGLRRKKISTEMLAASEQQIKEAGFVEITEEEANSIKAKIDLDKE
jgi:hypothetical protein